MITLTHERLGQARSCVETLLPAQYQETGDPLMPCEPNWAMYEKLEQTGAFMLIMVRDDDRAIGYCAAILHPSMNSRQMLVGTISTYFVEERDNRAFILKTMLGAVQDMLFARGAKQIKIETEYTHSAARLLERMGYQAEAVRYRINAPSVAAASREKQNA